MKQHTIWDSNGWLDILDDETWKNEYIAEYYPEYLEDEDKLMDLAIQLNNDYLDDEKVNLDYPCILIAIGEVGLWHGYYSGYQIGENLNECFRMSGVNGDYSCRIYVEGQTLKGDFAHHDCPMGYTLNFYIIERKPENDNFIERLYNDDVDAITPSMVKRYLRSAGRKVKEVYGF